MKKLFVIFLTAMLVVTFVACRDSDADINGSIKTENEDTITEDNAETDEKELSIGHSEGNVYESEFIGIGFKLPENWSFYTDEQMKAINNIAEDLVGEEYEEEISNAKIIYDMHATDANGNNVNINIEKLNAGSALTYTEEEYINASIGTLEDILSAIEGEATAKKTTVIIAGEKHQAIEVTCLGEQMALYEKIICIKIGQYMANVTVTTVGSDNTSEIVKQFYSLD